MAEARVIAKNRVTRKIAGVNFIEGEAVVDVTSAAFAFFARNSGFTVKPFEESATESEDTFSEVQVSEEAEVEAEPVNQHKVLPQRPAAVGTSNAEWFEYLEALNPEHGLEPNAKRGEIIAAVEAFEAAK